MSETRNNARPTRGRPFAKGNAGRPKGSRHRSTLAIQALLEGEAEAIGRTCVQAALAGDMVAIKLVLDRVAPAPKDRAVSFALPPIASVSDLPTAALSIIGAVAEGDLTPAEGAQIAGLLEAYRKHSEASEFADRIAAVEAALAQR